MAKRKSRLYFTWLTQAAIVAYNQFDPDIPEERIRREKIFNRFMYYPLTKLAENLVNNWDTDYIEEPNQDLQVTVLSYILEALYKFKPESGYKAFSYFTIVGRNYLIMLNKKGYEKAKAKASIDQIDIQRDVHNELHISEERQMKSDFIDLFCDYWDNNITKLFDTQRDIMIADSILYFFRNRERIEKYNKKYLYILIRERTGLKTQYITRVAMKLKAKYEEMYISYSKSGQLF